MSRSTKKSPVFKDSSSYYKKKSNKRFRKRSIEETNLDHKKYTNSYDICDWRYHFFNKKNTVFKEGAFRK